jgi:hypothetical protein
MPSARLAQTASAPSAVFIRLVAALAAMATVVIIPLTFASAAIGRTGVTTAFETAGIAAALAIVTAFAARSVDPLRK